MTLYSKYMCVTKVEKLNEEEVRFVVVTTIPLFGIIESM